MDPWSVQIFIAFVNCKPVHILFTHPEMLKSDYSWNKCMAIFVWLILCCKCHCHWSFSILIHHIHITRASVCARMIFEWFCSTHEVEKYLNVIVQLWQKQSHRTDWDGVEQQGALLGACIDPRTFPRLEVTSIYGQRRTHGLSLCGNPVTMHQEMKILQHIGLLYRLSESIWCAPGMICFRACVSGNKAWSAYLQELDFCLGRLETLALK